MKWKFIDNPPRQGSSNGDWYDLTDGGYIIPAAILADKEQVKQVLEAAELLESFFCAMRKAGIVVEM